MVSETSEAIIWKDLTIASSGAVTVSGALIVDNNYYAIVQAIDKLTKEIVKSQ